MEVAFTEASVLPLRGLHRGGERRDQLVEIADRAVAATGKIGAVGVLVDRHDHRRALHPDQVLMAPEMPAAM